MVDVALGGQLSGVTWELLHHLVQQLKILVAACHSPLVWVVIHTNLVERRLGLYVCRNHLLAGGFGFKIN